MAKIRCKITGPTPLGEKRVGEEFVIETDADGIPMDFFWRRRFEEGAHLKGFIQIMSAPVSVQPPPTTPPVTPETSQS